MEWVSSSANHQQSTSAQGAGGSPDPPCLKCELRARLEKGKCCFPGQRRIGAEVGSRWRVPPSRMQLPEASLVPFLRWALSGSLPSWLRMRCWGLYTQSIFRTNLHTSRRRARLELVSAPVTTSKALLHTEQKAAHTLLGPMGSTE